MAGVDFGFNIAKGRIIEFFNRVDVNDPADSALVIVIIAESGIEADATLRDHDNLSLLLAGSSNEVTNTNYARKVLADADITLPAPDDTNDRYDITLPDFVWNPGPASGDNWGKLLVCYDPDSTGGVDTAIIPLTAHALPPLIPDGSIMTISDPATGFFRAQ